MELEVKSEMIRWGMCVNLMGKNETVLGWLTRRGAEELTWADPDEVDWDPWLADGC